MHDALDKLDQIVSLLAGPNRRPGHAGESPDARSALNQLADNTSAVAIEPAIDTALLGVHRSDENCR